MSDFKNTANTAAYEPLFESQQMILTWTLRMSALLSFLGSTLIIYMIGHRRFKNTIHNRLLMGMSGMDILQCLNFLVGPAMVPSYTGLYGTRGTDGTCKAQGFLMTWAGSVGFYMVMLCFYYLAVIKYNTAEHVLRNYEVYMHGIALGLPLTLGIVGLCLDLYHVRPRSSNYCWVGTGCEFVSDEVEEGNCIPRPDAMVNTFEYGIYGLLLINWVLILSCMTLIYLSVRRRPQSAVERTTRKKDHSLEQRSTALTASTNTTNSAAAAFRKQQLQRSSYHRGTLAQVFLYVSAYFICFFPSIVSTSSFLGFESFVLSWFDAFLFPLQGFFNLVAFLHPCYIVLQARNQNKSFLGILKIILWDNTQPNTNPGTVRRSNEEEEEEEEEEERKIKKGLSGIIIAMLKCPNTSFVNRKDHDEQHQHFSTNTQQPESMDTTQSSLDDQLRSSLVHLVAQDFCNNLHTVTPPSPSNDAVSTNLTGSACHRTKSLAIKPLFCTNNDEEDPIRRYSLPVRRYYPKSSAEFGIFDGTTSSLSVATSPWAEHISGGIDEDYDYEDRRSDDDEEEQTSNCQG